MCSSDLPPESIRLMMGKDTLKRPSEMGIRIEPGVENALLKCLAVDKKKRYQDVQSMINGLYNPRAPRKPVAAVTTPQTTSTPQKTIIPRTAQGASIPVSTPSASPAVDKKAAAKPAAATAPATKPATAKPAIQAKPPVVKSATAKPAATEKAPTAKPTAKPAATAKPTSTAKPTATPDNKANDKNDKKQPAKTPQTTGGLFSKLFKK